MLLIKDHNSDNFNKTFGYTEKEDALIRLSVHRNLTNGKNTRLSQVVQGALEDLTEVITPSFELITAVSFHTGLYGEKINSGRTEELVMERIILETIVG